MGRLVAVVRDWQEGYTVGRILRSLEVLMIQAAQTLPLAASSDVRAFAEEQGVARYLPTVLENTQRLFPNAQRLAVRVVEDPEIANDRHIVFEVDVPLAVPEARAAQRRWNDALFAACPAPLVCVFTLSMDLLPA